MHRIYTTTTICPYTIGKVVTSSTSTLLLTSTVTIECAKCKEGTATVTATSLPPPRIPGTGATPETKIEHFSTGYASVPSGSMGAGKIVSSTETVYPVSSTMVSGA